jgi:RNA polymerase sigma-70 factor (ECF subfamily)
MFREDNMRSIDADLVELLPYMHKLANKIFRNAEYPVEDLVGDSVLRAIKYSSQFRPGSNMKSWLFTIMRNTYYNWYNHNKRAKFCRFDDMSLIEQPPIVESNDPELEAAVKTAIDSMKPIYAMMISLYKDGYTYSEMAFMCDIPVGTVMSRLARAKDIIKGKLDAFKT